MNARNLVAGTALAVVGLFSGVVHADQDGVINAASFIGQPDAAGKGETPAKGEAPGKGGDDHGPSEPQARVVEVIKSANYLGQTGYIMTPNAYVQPANSFVVGTHYVAGSNRALPSVAVVHGGVGLFDVIELGGAHRVAIDSPVANAPYMHGKLKVTPEKFPIQIAGGVLDGTNNLARSFYGVATVDLLQSMRRRAAEEDRKPGTIQSVQIGGGYRWQEVGGFGAPACQNGFVNGAVQFGKNIQLMGEWNPNQNFGCNPFYPLVGEVNAGIRARLGVKGLTADISGIGLDDRDRTYGAGLNYTVQFGKRRSDES